MGDYACFVVRCDPAKVEVIRDELDKHARDVKGSACGLVSGLWKTSGGPRSIGVEIDGCLCGGVRKSYYQITVVHEPLNAVNEKTSVVEV